MVERIDDSYWERSEHTVPEATSSDEDFILGKLTARKNSGKWAEGAFLKIGRSLRSSIALFYHLQMIANIHRSN